MRKSGNWMSLVDDRVLEYIDENSHGSPKEMKKNGPIDFSRGYIAERCKKLVDEGLLIHIGNGVYMLSEAGERYLEGSHSTIDDNGSGRASG